MWAIVPGPASWAGQGELGRQRDDRSCICAGEMAGGDEEPPTHEPGEDSRVSSTCFTSRSASNSAAVLDGDPSTVQLMSNCPSPGTTQCCRCEGWNSWPGAREPFTGGMNQTLRSTVQSKSTRVAVFPSSSKEVSRQSPNDSTSRRNATKSDGADIS